MIFNDSLLIFEDEIRQRSRWQAFVEFLRKHTFDLRPIHRYRGQLTLIGDVLGIDMRHVRTSVPLVMNIPLSSIVGLDIGYNGVFSSLTAPRWPWRLGPIGVVYKDEGGMDTTIYLFADYDPGWNVYPNCRNEDLFEAMSNRIVELQAKKS
jgi:hypothetical protein